MEKIEITDEDENTNVDTTNIEIPLIINEDVISDNGSYTNDSHTNESFTSTKITDDDNCIDKIDEPIIPTLLNINKFLDELTTNSISIKKIFKIKNECRFFKAIYNERIPFFIRIPPIYSLDITKINSDEYNNIKKVSINGDKKAASQKLLSYLFTIKGDINFDIVNYSESILTFLSDNTIEEVYVISEYKAGDILTKKKTDIIQDLILEGESLLNLKSENSSSDDELKEQPLDFEEDEPIQPMKKVIKENININLIPSSYENENIYGGNYNMCVNIELIHQYIKNNTFKTYINNCSNNIEKNKEKLRDAREDELKFSIKTFVTKFETDIKKINEKRQSLINTKLKLVSNLEKWSTALKINNQKNYTKEIEAVILKSRKAIKALTVELEKLNSLKDDLLSKYEAILDDTI